VAQAARIHDPAKVVLDLAVTLALGGDCLTDVAILRGEPDVYGPVALDPTVSRTIDTLAKDGPRALAAINPRCSACAATVCRASLSASPIIASGSNASMVVCSSTDRTTTLQGSTAAIDGSAWIAS